nr:MAG TPA: hypothetical protein [Caudoviricetes sp.]DAU97439.1 MAG TPA: hypothetical protein [Caudoviricetes sp.]DAW85058.1 MAG TPA: hypothetical protein [Bacteriophage sp.]
MISKGVASTGSDVLWHGIPLISNGIASQCEA